MRVAFPNWTLIISHIMKTIIYHIYVYIYMYIYVPSLAKKSAFLSQKTWSMADGGMFQHAMTVTIFQWWVADHISSDRTFQGLEKKCAWRDLPREIERHTFGGTPLAGWYKFHGRPLIPSRNGMIWGSPYFEKAPKNSHLESRSIAALLKDSRSSLRSR